MANQVIDSNPICFLTNNKVSRVQLYLSTQKIVQQQCMHPPISQYHTFPTTQTADKFFSSTWEKQPTLFKANPDRKSFCKDLFGLQSLLDLAKERFDADEPLEFGLDLNATRYLNQKRETLNKEVADRASIEDLFHKERCTVQFHQPQRFDDQLWRICAALENQLGCLVGCNAYITPKNSQGLDPHFDDVEIFVLQTEGTKSWKVYSVESCKLANKCSGGIPEEILPEPLLEVTLSPGDVLYLPRGTIHQACAGNDHHSSHLTLSTYQRWSYGDLAQHVVSVALADPGLHEQLPRSAKEGLPPGFMHSMQLSGIVASSNSNASLSSTTAQGAAIHLAKVLRDLASVLEKDEQQVGEEAISSAADFMSEDFMRNRLPPHPSQLVASSSGDTSTKNKMSPSLDDFVECTADIRNFHLIPLQPSEEGQHGHEGGKCSDSECEEDHDHSHHHHHHGHVHTEDCQHDHDHDEEEVEHEHEHEMMVRLLSCLQNDRDAHMMPYESDDDDESDEDDDASDDEKNEEENEGEEDDDMREDLVFPAEMVPALLQVLSSKGQGVKVKDIDFPDEAVKQQLAVALWEVGIVAVVPKKTSNNGSEKRKKKQEENGKEQAKSKKKNKK